MIVLSPAASADRELLFCNINVGPHRQQQQQYHEVLFATSSAAIWVASSFPIELSSVEMFVIGEATASDSPVSASVPIELSSIVMFVIEPEKRQCKRERNKSSGRNRRSDSERGTGHETKVVDGIADSSTKTDITLRTGGLTTVTVVPDF